jgi:hypothetical protein
MSRYPTLSLEPAPDRGGVEHRKSASTDYGVENRSEQHRARSGA